jgi:hypothetical protein
MKLILLLVTGLLSQNLFAEDGGKSGVDAFHFLNVSNPAVVVSALDKFSASSCRKNLPADVLLLAEQINGSQTSTHFIIVSYDKTSDFQKAQKLLSTCPEGRTMMQEIASGADRVSESLIMPVIEVGDSGKDGVFIKYDIKTSNEADYAAAWTELMESNVAAGTMTGSYGINRVFVGNDKASHFVYYGASDFATLAANQGTLNSSPEFSKFAKRVGGLRDVINTSLLFPVKSWPRQ